MCVSLGEFKKYKVQSLHLSVKTNSGRQTSICKIIAQQLRAKLCNIVHKFENNSEKEELSEMQLPEKDPWSGRH